MSLVLKSFMRIMFMLFYSQLFDVLLQSNFAFAVSICIMLCLLHLSNKHCLLGGVAQWLERRSLTGELSMVDM